MKSFLGSSLKPVKIKLGLKLQTAFDLIEDHYENVWDTCCDHGNLGVAFLRDKKASKVHFVDQVETIMSSLETKLQGLSELETQRYQLHTKPAQDLDLSSNDLLCICGVGGEVLIEILKALKPECDLLLSPHYHLYEVRKFLKESGYKSIKEKIVFEKQFGREIFYLSKKEGSPVDLTGGSLFNSSPEHLNYLKGIISHLEKKKMDEALALYRNLLNNLLSPGMTK